MRVYPPIEPQMTVGEYLDRKIVKYPLPNKGKFTDSEDYQVEKFWAGVVMDTVKLTELTKLRRPKK